MLGWVYEGLGGGLRRRGLTGEQANMDVRRERLVTAQRFLDLFGNLGVSASETQTVECDAINARSILEFGGASARGTDGRSSTWNV